MKLHLHSARSLARRIREKDLSPIDLFHLHKGEIDKMNGALRALRVVNQNAASDAEARARELESGSIPGRLHGVCFCVKDNINVAGLPRSQGSLEGSIERDDVGAQLVELLLKEGAICVGKSNMSEFGKSYFTDNAPFGRTLNPFNHNHSPGGSSGGDAAAVAAGFASFGLASDAGGSIRVPANFCGLFGLHPTRGLYTEGGMAYSGHFISALFRSSGVLARSIDDIELLHSILAHPDLADPMSIAAPPFFGRRRTNSFGWYSSLEDLECDDAVGDDLVETVKRLEALGFTARKITPTVIERSLHPFIILAGQAAFMLEDLLFARAGRPRDHDKEGPMVKMLRTKIATQLPPLTPDALLLALDDIQRLRRDAVRLFDEVDFLLSPVSATLAPRHDSSTFEIRGKHYEPHEVFRYSSAVNVLGLPAVAFPTKLSSNGLPMGLQLIGPRFSEMFLFELLRSAGFKEALRPQ